MKEYFKKELAFFDLIFSSKKEAIDKLSQALVEKGYGVNYNSIYKAALQREEEFSTSIGNYIAMPHIRIPEMKKSVLLYAKVQSLDWDSTDGEKIRHIFFIALNDKDNIHMEIIQGLSKNVMNPKFIEKLDNNNSFDGLLELFDQNNNSLVEEESITNSDGYYDVVAVTACPTGIAHTYMAKDSLVAKAKEMGVSIKVETQGTEGSRNALTQDEIDNAKGVVLAIDRAIDLGRFTKHKNVLETSTRKTMKKPEEEINFVLDKKGKQIKSTTSSGNSNDAIAFNFDNFGKRLYKALMTGVSYMLPFVIFGGIMIAIAFMIDTFSGNKDAGSAFGTVNPGAKWFKFIGGLSFDLMVPILSAYIAYALVGKIGLLPAFVTGMISAGKMGPFQEATEGDPALGWLGTPTGVNSGFFGAIAGAILVSVLLILIMKYIVPKVPAMLNGIMQILIIPFFGTLVIVGIFFIVNIPFLYLNDGFMWVLSEIGKIPGLMPLLCLLLGLMMATDMGGPINKAAYVFATATLTNADGSAVSSIPMAATMAAGMIPPLGIALSTGIFRTKLWTKEEIDTTAANVVMGFSFITEGAIPFAAKDPKTIIPSSMAGSAIAGLMVALFQIGVSAPHGGIFVLPLVKTTVFDTTPLQIGLGITFYLVSIITGAFVTMLMIWIFKSFIWKDKNQKNSDNLDKIKQNKKSKFNFKKEGTKKQIIKSNYINNMLLKRTWSIQ